jgi:lipopolysaccharide export LptBFGC system permease protein LptF
MPRKPALEASEEKPVISEVAVTTDSLAVGETERDYAVVSFGKLSKSETVGDSEDLTEGRAQTTPDLLAVSRDEDAKDRDRGRALATVLERYAGSLQCLVLAFIGLPLAVWIRPSGKSIGVVFAFALILVYYLMMRTGKSMIENDPDGTLGRYMIFSPVLLFLAAGAVLWRRMIRT